MQLIGVHYRNNGFLNSYDIGHSYLFQISVDGLTKTTWHISKLGRPRRSFLVHSTYVVIAS